MKYVVEKIFGHGQTKHYFPYFLVKWKGYQADWETYDELKHLQKLKAYMKKHNLEIHRGYLVERLDDEITQDVDGEFKEVGGKLKSL
jgi:hypothetical protein